MLTFQCSNCTKTLRVNEEHAGKRVACSCGQKMVVPSSSTAAASLPTANQPTAAASSLTKIQVACQQCGVKLAVPSSAIGKAVKCKCGAVVPIRSPGSGVAPRANPTVAATPVSAAPDPFASPAAYSSGDDNIFGNLSATDLSSPSNWQAAPPPMPGNAAAGSAYYSQPAAAYSAGGSYAAGSSYGSSSSTRGKKGATTNAYIASATQELEKQRQSELVSWNPFNETTLAGVAMIGGAVAWFVGGLFFGIIFFYPPILLVLGMITLGRGLLASDN